MTGEGRIFRRTIGIDYSGAQTAEAMRTGEKQDRHESVDPVHAERTMRLPHNNNYSICNSQQYPGKSPSASTVAVSSWA
jgi:hypothetical protein